MTSLVFVAEGLHYYNNIGENWLRGAGERTWNVERKIPEPMEVYHEK